MIDEALELAISHAVNGPDERGCTTAAAAKVVLVNDYPEVLAACNVHPFLRVAVFKLFQKFVYEWLTDPKKSRLLGCVDGKKRWLPAFAYYREDGTCYWRRAAALEKRHLQAIDLEGDKDIRSRMITGDVRKELIAVMPDDHTTLGEVVSFS
ncbi:hypothetical protein LCGC14_1049200 [marine sediment metagenome]|uniref:Uncharacterized protein n=1 Tax=marine sediment metagenome TaxID=412755 RepID=A0A0F9NB81_9ZZZZ